MPRTRESGKEHRNRKRRTSDAKRTFQSKGGTPCGPARYRRWQIRKRTPHAPGRTQRTAVTVPLHIPRTPFSLALIALFVSDSKGVLLCCVASLFPPFLFGREGTQRWTGSSRPNARRNLFEPLTTSPDTWTTGGSAERSMGAAFGLRALTHLSRPPQAIWGFVMLGFAPVCIRQVRN